MSHELRTPLNAILGFSEVMKTEVFGPHAVPAYKEYSGDIHNSGEHLLNLINEILDLSRIEAGRYELNEEPVSLTHVVEDCHHLLTAARQEPRHHHPRGVRAGPAAAVGRRARAAADLPQLAVQRDQVHAAGRRDLAQGRLDRVGRPVHERQGHRPGHSGRGNPDRARQFGQGSNAIKSAEQGTGLGLPIAKNLIDLHGGTFTLKSKVRIGTEVIVTFPPERVMAALAPLSEPVAADPAAARAPIPAAARASARCSNAQAERFRRADRLRSAAAALILGAGFRFLTDAPPWPRSKRPANKICIVDQPSGLCRGCGRSLAEIARWTAYSDGERARIMAELPQRLDAMNARAAVRRR